MSFKKIFTTGICLLLAGCGLHPSNYNPNGLNSRFDHEYTSPEDEYKNGYRYLLGSGTPRNYPKALHYFRKAADQGNASAQNQLGFLYAAGKGVTQDYALAASWYQKAAAQHVASAQYSLGILYQHGLGVPKDTARAHALFKEAQTNGFTPAVRALAQ